MKTCFRCNKPQPLSEFYKHPKMADGHLNKCKSCTRADAEARRAEKGKDPQWLLAERARHREKQRRRRQRGLDLPLTKAKRAEVNKRYKQKNPEKVAAHSKCQHMKKQPCSVCGNPDGQKHHEDYSKPKDVVWLCAKHHAERHVQIRNQKTTNEKRT